ncbi:MAG: hypothetical protein V4710_19530 [Verrucomicrobiota bacterium]
MRQVKSDGIGNGFSVRGKHFESLLSHQTQRGGKFHRIPALIEKLDIFELTIGLGVGAFLEIFADPTSCDFGAHDPPEPWVGIQSKAVARFHASEKLFIAIFRVKMRFRLCEWGRVRNFVF